MNWYQSEHLQRRVKVKIDLGGPMLLLEDGRDGRVLLLQHGDVVRARGWTAPHPRATSPVRKEAVTDGLELTIDDALEAT